MKKIIKIISFYDDGTFTESIPSAPYSPMPINPWQDGYKKIDPSDPFPSPPLDPYSTPQWPRTHCSKCGLEFKGGMGYVCNNYPCPSGLGGVSCSNESK